MQRETTEIIKHLEKCTASGIGQSEVFDDFLEMTLTSLERLPEHLKTAVATGKLADDTEETSKLWERLRRRYGKPWYFREFHAAFHILLESTWEYADVIGEVYMEFGIPNKRSGQFFTPFEIARLMAGLTAGMDDIYRLLAEAYGKTTYGIMQKMLYGDDPNAEARMLAFVARMGEDIVPLCAEHIRPLTVNDCACGSGVMFLAAASVLEPWVHKWGLIQFSGQDIDQTCVRMAQVNMMLYGLNGYQIKCALALTGQELAAIPEPYQAAYQEAQVAAQENQVDRLTEITEQVRNFKQLALI